MAAIHENEVKEEELAENENPEVSFAYCDCFDHMH